MGTIRRTLGGFVLAGAIAASLVLMPATVEAKQKGGTTPGSFCATLNAAIAYISATYSGDLGAALLAPLEAARDAYCPLPTVE